MEIKVDKAVLKKAVSLAKKAISRVVVQQERSHILCTVKTDKMIVMSTNNDLKALCIIPIENPDSKEFSFTADPKILEKLLSKISMSTIRISHNSEENLTKVYTKDSEKSFSTLQSFPPDRMLTFDVGMNGARSYPVSKKALLFALDFSANFLAPLKEEQKHFDFITIDRGIIYAANGSNKMGLLVFKTFQNVIEYKIRKSVAPFYKSFVEKMDGDSVTIVDTDKNIGVISEDNSMFFGCLKANIETPRIPKEHIVSEGPYIEVDKNELLNAAQRLVVNDLTPQASGLELKLRGTGKDSYLETVLVSELDSREDIKCVRQNDSGEDVDRVVNYKLFESVLGSFDISTPVRMHMQQGKFFKIYTAGQVGEDKYIAACIGAYATIRKH